MKNVLRILAVLLLLALLALLVPSSVPLVIAEDEPVYPTYTVPRPELEEITPIDWAAETPYAPHKNAYSSDSWQYADPSIIVHTEKMRAYGTDILLTWVSVADASQIRTHLSYGKIQGEAILTVNKMAQTVKAVLAIDGDNCKDTKYKGSGYIVRNGVVLRQKKSQFDALIIDDRGDLHVITNPTPEKMMAFEGKIVHSFNFGPALIIDGEPVTREHVCSNKSLAPTKRAQRICFGQVDSLTYLIIATEGPENRGSKGLTMPEFLDVVSHFGYSTAYNLDGGSSSAVVMNYKKINSLSTGKNRAVSDTLYFVTGVPEGVEVSK